MGDRLSGDGGTGRRRARPGRAVSGRREAPESAALEAVLAAVLRGGDLDPEAERRALSAFRAAHGAGARRARTRHRDDWRLSRERRARIPLRVTFGAVFAGLALGGVAVAAIGSAGSSADGAGTGRETAQPSARTPGRPGGEAPSSPSAGRATLDGPAHAQDTEAHCRAFEQVRSRGKALDARVWKQLVTAAGGEDEVAAYCSEQVARAAAAPSRLAGTGRPGTSATGAGNGTAGNTGTSGNGAAGSASAGPGNAAGGGRAGGGKDGGKHG